MMYRDDESKKRDGGKEETENLEEEIWNYPAWFGLILFFLCSKNPNGKWLDDVWPLVGSLISIKSVDWFSGIWSWQ